MEDSTAGASATTATSRRKRLDDMSREELVIALREMAAKRKAAEDLYAESEAEKAKLLGQVAKMTEEHSGRSVKDSADYDKVVAERDLIKQRALDLISRGKVAQTKITDLTTELEKANVALRDSDARIKELEALLLTATAAAQTSTVTVESSVDSAALAAATSMLVSMKSSLIAAIDELGASNQSKSEVDATNPELLLQYYIMQVGDVNKESTTLKEQRALWQSKCKDAVTALRNLRDQLETKDRDLEESKRASQSLLDTETQRLSGRISELEAELAQMRETTATSQTSVEARLADASAMYEAKLRDAEASLAHVEERYADLQSFHDRELAAVHLNGEKIQETFSDAASAIRHAIFAIESDRFCTYLTDSEVARTHRDTTRAVEVNIYADMDRAQVESSVADLKKQFDGATAECASLSQSVFKAREKCESDRVAYEIAKASSLQTEKYVDALQSELYVLKSSMPSTEQGDNFKEDDITHLKIVSLSTELDLKLQGADALKSRLSHLEEALTSSSSHFDERRSTLVMAQQFMFDCHEEYDLAQKQFDRRFAAVGSVVFVSLAILDKELRAHMRTKREELHVIETQAALEKRRHDEFINELVKDLAVLLIRLKEMEVDLDVKSKYADSVQSKLDASLAGYNAKCSDFDRLMEDLKALQTSAEILMEEKVSLSKNLEALEEQLRTSRSEPEPDVTQPDSSTESESLRDTIRGLNEALDSKSKELEAALSELNSWRTTRESSIFSSETPIDLTAIRFADIPNVREAEPELVDVTLSMSPSAANGAHFSLHPNKKPLIKPFVRPRTLVKAKRRVPSLFRRESFAKALNNVLKLCPESMRMNDARLVAKAESLDVLSHGFGSPRRLMFDQSMSIPSPPVSRKRRVDEDAVKNSVPQSAASGSTTEATEAQHEQPTSSYDAVNPMLCERSFELDEVYNRIHELELMVSDLEDIIATKDAQLRIALLEVPSSPSKKADIDDAVSVVDGISDMDSRLAALVAERDEWKNRFESLRAEHTKLDNMAVSVAISSPPPQKIRDSVARINETLESKLRGIDQYAATMSTSGKETSGSATPDNADIVKKFRDVCADLELKTQQETELRRKIMQLESELEHKMVSIDIKSTDSAAVYSEVNTPVSFDASQDAPTSIRMLESINQSPGLLEAAGDDATNADETLRRLKANLAIKIAELREANSEIETLRSRVEYLEEIMSMSNEMDESGVLDMSTYESPEKQFEKINAELDNNLAKLLNDTSGFNDKFRSYYAASEKKCMDIVKVFKKEVTNIKVVLDEEQLKCGRLTALIDEQELDISRKTAEIERLSKNLQEDNKALVTAQEKLANVNEEYAALMKRFESLEVKSREEVAALKTENATLISSKESLTSERDSLSQKTAKLQEECKALSDEIATIRNARLSSASSLTVQLEAKAMEYAALNASHRDLEASLEKAKKKAERIPVLESRCAELEAQMASMTAEKGDSAGASAVEIASLQETADRVPALEARVAELQQELEAKASAASDLEATLATATEDLAKAKNELATSATAVSEMETSLESTRSRCVVLENEVAFLQSQVASLSAEKGDTVGALTAEIASLQETADRVPALEARVAELQQELEAKALAASDLEATLATATEDLAKAKNELATSASVLSEMEVSLASARTRCSELEGKISSLQSQVATLSAEKGDTVSALTAELTSLREEHNKSLSANAALKETETKLRSSLDKSITKLRSMKAELEAAVGAAKSAEGRVAELEASLATSAAELSTAREEIAAQATVVTDLETSLQSALARSTELEREVASLQDAANRAAVLETRVAELQKELDAKATILAELETSIESARTTQSSFEDEVASLQSQVASLSTELEATHEAAKNIPTLESRVAELQQEVTAKSASIVDLEATVQTSAVRVSELEEALAAATSDLAKARCDVAAAEEIAASNTSVLAELEALREEHNKSLSANAPLKETETKLRSSLDKSITKLRSMKAELEAAVGAAKSAEGRVTELEADIAVKASAAAELGASLESTRSRCALLENEVVSLQSQVATLSAEKGDTVGALTAELTSRAAEILAMQKEHDKLQDELKQAKDAVSASDARVNETESSLAVANKQLEGLQQELQEKESKTNDLQRQFDETLADLRSAKSALEKSSQDYERDTLRLLNEIKLNNSSLQKSMNELESARNRNYAYEEEIKLLRLKLEELSSNAEETTSGTDTNANITELIAKVDTLSSDLKAVNEARLADTNELQSVRNELAAVRSELEVRTTELAEAQALVREAEALRVRLSAAAEVEGRLNLSLEKAVTELKTVYEKLQETEENLALKSESESVLESKCVQLEEEINSIRGANVEGAGDYSALKESFEALENECSDLRASLNAMNAEKEQLLAHIDSLQEDVASKTATIDELIKAAEALDNGSRDHESQAGELAAKLNDAKELEKKLRANLDKAVQQIRSLKQHEQELGVEFNELQDKLKDSLSRAVQLEALLTERDGQIDGYIRIIAELEDRLASARTEAVTHADRARIASAALSDLTERPSYFDILLRCSDGSMGWNLIRRPMVHKDSLHEHASVDQEDMDIMFPATRTHEEASTRLEWRSDEELRQWHHIKMSDGHMNKTINGFSISGDDDELVLPPTVQETLTASFERERQVLLGDIERLKDEVQNSTAAYDKYRERARLSLTKASNEQAGFEKKIKDLSAQVKFFERRAQETEAAQHRERESHITQLRELRDRITSYVTVSEALQAEIELLRSQVLVLQKQQAEASHSSSSSSSSSPHMSLADAAKFEKLVVAERDLQQQLTEAVTECDRLRTREKALEKDIKKRGDAARQLVITKDEEIARLRKKLARLTGSAYTGTELPVADTTITTATSTSSSTYATSAYVDNAPPTPSTPSPSTPVTPTKDTASSNTPLALTTDDAIGTPLSKLDAHTNTTTTTAAPSSATVAASATTTATTATASTNPTNATATTGASGVTDLNHEQQFLYLRQAFFAFAKARDSSEMQQIGKVITVILGMSQEEQSVVHNAIAKLSPAVSIDNLSSNLASYFFR